MESFYQNLEQLNNYIPKPGDIIGYSKPNESINYEYNSLNMTHVAVVESNPNNRTLNSDYRNEIIVTSKWGEDGGIYRHGIEDYETFDSSNTILYLFRLNLDGSCQLSSNTTSFNDNLTLTQKPNNGPVKSNYGLYKINITNPGLYSFPFNSITYPTQLFSFG